MRGGGLRRRDYHSTRDFIVGGVFLYLHIGEFELCNQEGLVQGAPVCGGFGHGGQDIHMVSWS
jgi:hypothetical protein